MNKEAISKELKEFLIDELLVELSVEEITNEMSLGNELDVDSLGFTELMAHLEDTYQIKIKDSEFTPDNFRCINNILNLLEKKGVLAA